MAREAEHLLGHLGVAVIKEIVIPVRVVHVGLPYARLQVELRAHRGVGRCAEGR